jgi:hypothetical protein
MTVAEAVLVKNWQLLLKDDKKALFNLIPLADELDSLPDRSESDPHTWFFKPDGEPVDWFKPAHDRLTKLINERNELRAELRRRKRARAEKMRRDAQSQDTRDPLA